jgi:plastocyanin
MNSTSSKALGLAIALTATVAMVAIPTGAFGGAETAASHTVILKNISFHPGTLSIKRGESVKWVWKDGETEHNVTFHGSHSRTMASGSYTLKFTNRGTFNYRCTIHESEGMRGKIVVH